MKNRTKSYCLGGALSAALILLGGVALADAELAPTTDFSQIEPGEDRPGGDTTHFKRLNRAAFSASSANLRVERALDGWVG